MKCEKNKKTKKKYIISKVLAGNQAKGKRFSLVEKLKFQVEIQQSE